MATTRIHLPATYPDVRVDKLRVYKVNDAGVTSLLAEVPVGTTDVLDPFTTFGSNYYYTAKDSTSGNESAASQIARVFRRRSTTPTIF